MKLLFLILSTTALAADFDHALSLPKRTENLVFRDRLKPNWLPDGKSFWYRVQTGPKTHEFVLIQAKTGTRKTAQSLKALGLPEQEALRSSTTRIELRKTTRTGEESGLKFINQLDTDLDLFWISQDGKHIRYGGIRAGAEREQHTFDGHVWLITSRTGEHLAIIEAGPQIQTLIIDGKGFTPPKKKAKKQKPETAPRTAVAPSHASQTSCPSARSPSSIPPPLVSSSPSSKSSTM